MMTNSKTILKVGSRVYSGLYGGRHGIVFAIHGKQSPESCAVNAGIMHTGGTAQFDVVFDNGGISQDLSESIIRGVQWKLYDEVATPEEIATALANHAMVSAQERAKETEEANAFSTECTRLKEAEEYAHLVKSDENERHQVAKNLRSELKKHFKGVKFSVRNSDHSAFNINWTDGPTSRQVEAVTNKFRSGSFDSMQDMYEYHRCPFTTIFGSARYIFCNRENSPEAITKAIAQLQEKYSANFKEMERVPTADDYINGRTHSIIVPHLDNFSRMLYEQLQQNEA